jgi:hypothetical protein
MFVQNFFIKETFLFHRAIIDWNAADKVRIEVNSWTLGLEFGRSKDLSVITFHIAQSFFVWVCYSTNIVNCYKDFVLHWARFLWLRFKSLARCLEIEIPSFWTLLIIVTCCQISYHSCLLEAKKPNNSYSYKQRCSNKNHIFWLKLKGWFTLEAMGIWNPRDTLLFWMSLWQTLKPTTQGPLLEVYIRIVQKKRAIAKYNWFCSDFWVCTQ